MVDSSSQVDSDICAIDAPVGFMLVVLAGIGAVATMLLHSALMVLIGSRLDSAHPETTFVAGQSLSYTTVINGEPPATTFFLTTALPLILCSLIAICGVGIAGGKFDGFRGAIVVFGLLMVLGGGVSALSVAVVVYCGLRLLGIVGPEVKPMLFMNVSEERQD